MNPEPPPAIAPPARLPSYSGQQLPINPSRARLAKGVIHDRILRTRHFTPVAHAGADRIDCAYLVTTGDAPYVVRQIGRLMDCAQRVVVLHTASCPAARDARFPAVEFIPFRGPLHESFLQRRSSSNPTLRWNRQFDIPSKRSHAITHAMAHGYSTIFLVDDDVLFRRSFVPTALALLRKGSDIVCSYSLYHPDISTLDRLRSVASGSPPEVTIGGNAVVLNVGPRLGLFPYVYNEDWLFLWSSMHYGAATITPIQTVLQRAPRPGRESLVRMEQFGELVVFMLFYENEARADLSRLRDESFITYSIQAYRRTVTELLQCSRSSALVLDALAAIEDITVADVRTFAEALESEIEQHYVNNTPH